MTTTQLLSRPLFFCSIALAFTACADRSASKEVAVDTTTVAEAAPAPPPADEAAPAETAPEAAPRVAFTQPSYDHNAGELFSLAATVYDANGSELHDEMVRYSFDRGGMAWLAKPEAGNSCKDIPPDDHHISLVARSGVNIIVCGEQKGAEATLHADAMTNLSASTTIVVR